MPLQPCPLCGTENKFDATEKPLDEESTEALMAEIDRAEICVAAFETPLRRVAEKSILEGLVLQLYDRLKSVHNALDGRVHSNQELRVLHNAGELLASVKIEKK